MTKPLTLILLTLALVAPASALSVSDLMDATERATQQIVAFHEMPALKRGDSYQGDEVVDLDDALRFVVVETTSPERLRLAALADPNVRYVEWNDPQYAHALFTPNDARYNDAGHYGSKIIGGETAWDRTLGAASVKVAVIDSGLLKTHEEFAGSGRVLQGYDAISEDNDPQDNCGHGTHVAGTIGATINNGVGIAGMAQVSIIPVRALTNSLFLLCSGSTADLAQALRYAGDQGAHLSSNSWGGGTSAAINDAISYAHARGVIHVAAAGNDGSCSNCVSEPWRTNADKVIIVSSTDANDGFSSFSSQGPQVDVAAPGSSILSSYNGGASSYSSLSGTSMATPHVTGTAALIKTLNPSWGYAQIDQRLKDTAVDLGANGKDDRFGFGRIDAAAATAGSSPAVACNDGIDNDGDGLTDYPADPGCASATDNDETNAPPTNNPPDACFTHTESGLATSASGACSSDADGSIVSYAWTWGDGATGSGASAGHTYAAAGTYTVTLTVTDDDGATDSVSQQVSVTNPGDPDPATPTLANGETRSATSGASGSDQFYKIDVPSGASQLQVVIDGPACTGLLTCSPDLDLYVRHGARPTDSAWECRPYLTGSDETCTLSGPAAGWWYVRVDVYSGSNVGYTVRATWT